MARDFAKRIGVDVHITPKQITPPATTPLQTAVIIGECYAVEDQIATGVKYLGYPVEVSYKTKASVPGNIMTSLTEEDRNTVQVFIETSAGIIEIEKATYSFASTGDVSSDGNGASNITNIADSYTIASGLCGNNLGEDVFIVTSGDDFSNASVGNYITVGGTDCYLIIEKLSNTSVKVDRVISSGYNDTDFVITPFGIHEPVTFDGDLTEYTMSYIAPSYITINADLTLTNIRFKINGTLGFEAMANSITIPSGIIYRGNILISYRAKRHDLDYTSQAVATMDDIEGIFGEDALGHENPIGYALKKCILRTGGTKTLYFVTIENDDEDSHLEAINTLEIMREKRPFYFVVPLSHNEVVGQAYQALITALNADEQRFACVLLWTPKLIYKDIILPVSNTGNIQSDTTLEDPEINFFEMGVQSGEYINIIGDDGVESGIEYEITNVDGHILTISSTFNIPTGSTVKYEIIGEWFQGTTSTDKQTQAEAYNNYCQSINNPRVWINLPDYLIDNGVVVPGYFQNASDAGFMMVSPEEKPLSGRQLLGFSGAIHSNDYFTSGLYKQIHKIESGGADMAIEVTEGGDLIYKTQYTTAMDDETFKYRSRIRNMDSAKMLFINTLCPMMGRDNVSPDFLTSFKLVTSVIIKRLQDKKQAGINATVKTIQVDPDDPTAIKIWIDLDLPYPANRATLFLLI